MPRRGRRGSASGPGEIRSLIKDEGDWGKREQGREQKAVDSCILLILRGASDLRGKGDSPSGGSPSSVSGYAQKKNDGGGWGRRGKGKPRRRKNSRGKGRQEICEKSARV